MKAVTPACRRAGQGYGIARRFVLPLRYRETVMPIPEPVEKITP